MLAYCPPIWKYWNSYYPTTTNLRQGMSFVEIVLFVNENGAQEELEVFFMMSCSFWHERNKWIHNKINCDPRQSIT